LGVFMCAGFALCTWCCGTEGLFSTTTWNTSWSGWRWRNN